jgi:hypothetical protein
MEGTAPYAERLEQALENQRRYLDQTTLPRLKSLFESMHGTYQNFYNVLLRKSLVREDPYKEEQKLSEIELPPTTEVAEIEKSDQIGLRLSMFDNQLDFLLQYYQFSIEYLTLKRIRLLAGLIRFINWDHLAATSTQINTRLLAEMVNKVRGSSDTFSIQVINNAQNQLVKICNDIGRSLKSLSTYHRERYKLEVRRSVLDLLDISQEAFRANQAAVTAQIKKRFGEALAGMPYYDDLVNEILAEDFGSNTQAKQEDVLNQLSIKTEKDTKKKQIDFRTLLLDAIRLLSVSGKPVERALAKLSESSGIIEEYRSRIDGPFKRWLARMLGKKKEARVYEVEIVDPATAVAKTMSVNFDNFHKKGVQTGRLIATYAGKTSPGYARLESMDEEGLYALLERNIIEIQQMTKMLPALHSYFQEEMDANNRGKLRGVKLEVNAIRNAVLKANQRRHEYVSRKEEKEQLKKLGIQ